MAKRLIALLTALGLVLAACGGDDDESSGGDVAGETPTTAGQEASEADPDGVVRLAYDLAAASRGGFNWDPSAATVITSDTGIHHWVYGSLLRPTPDGALEPDLAESAEVVDPNTIEVVIREGLTLSDGTPLDAAGVKTAIEANLAKVNNPAYRPGFYSLQSIELAEPNTLTLRIPDGSAPSWYDLFLAGPETVIVPAGTNFDAPVGAGPFTVAEFTPGQSMVLEKNPAYWDADRIQVAGIEITNTPPDNEQAAVSALNAGQVDWARISVSLIDAAGGNVELVTEGDPDMLTQFLVCKSAEPFDDARVRQALSMAIDRDVINEAVFNGAGQPAWDLWPEGHRLHNEELNERYAHDPEGARDLLTEAGAEALTVDVIPIAGANVPEVTQIIQQQWAEVGVTMNIVQSANFVDDFLTNNRAPLGAIPRSSSGRSKLDNFNGTGLGNACGYNDPELAGLIDQLRAVSDNDDAGVELWAQIQELIVEDSLGIFILFQPRVYGIDPSRIGGYELLDWYGIPMLDVKQIFVRA